MTLCNAMTNRTGLLQCRTVAALLGAALLAGCSSSLPPAIDEFAFQTPRPYGYLIGDVIHHRIEFQTRKDTTLNPASVPAPGDLNRWLHLSRATIAHQEDTGHTVIDLTYQVFYAANEVKMLNIPGFQLQFNQAGKTLEHSVPAWPFSLAPLQELAVRKDADGLPYRRPNAAAEPLSAAGPLKLLSASLTGAFALAAYLAYRYGIFPVWPKRRIFKRLQRELAKVPIADPQRGLALLHRAFNSLYGKPLFAHGLEGFYQAQPAYRRAAPSIVWFFELSDRVLFGGQSQVSAEDWRKLQELGRLCRQIECGRL
ncbi:nonribosomal peptide synthetase MxaA [Methylomonas sp. HYX-M1]|uniref:nonribosomal peptide synthetase MxaA n=1 Tax=Methylomonas sp. HYX-M1 TaxID=3139307 RepID=UPI00345BEBA0